MQLLTAPGAPYHRVARTAAHRWWRPLLGTLLLVVLGSVMMTAVYLAGEAAGVIAYRPVDADGFHSFGVVADTALVLLGLAVLLPCVLVTAHYAQARPAGTVSSVLGRLRWRWLGMCLLVAVPTLVLTLTGAELLFVATGDTEGYGETVGAGEFLTGFLALAALVPLQAAAEEYVCRGWFLQAVGALVRRPWLPIAVQAVLFAAAHGWGTVWGFADLLVFAVAAGWLTVRTGGLEAAIALHVVNNLIAMGLAAAFGDLASDETSADSPWQFLAADLVLIPAYAVVIARLARRRQLDTLTPAAADPRPAGQVLQQA